MRSADITKDGIGAVRSLAHRILSEANRAWAIGRESEEERTKSELNKLHDELEQIALCLIGLEAQSNN